tara:strand:+ start:214 stop:774 length:561 start_codon:yes stop_codon:yes gene_type:complete
MNKNNFFFHKTAILDEKVTVGEKTNIWCYTHVSKNVTIGKNCNIGQNVFIGENVRIGNNVKIQNNVSVYSGVILEDFVFCGPSCVFTNVKNPRSKFPTDTYQKTIVKFNASIGGNSTIVCGTSIGKFALIGAGSVVTKNVDDYTLVYGNPAKKKGWVSESGYKLDKNFFCKYENKSYLFLKNNKNV